MFWSTITHTDGSGVHVHAAQVCTGSPQVSAGALSGACSRQKSPPDALLKRDPCVNWHVAVLTRRYICI